MYHIRYGKKPFAPVLYECALFRCRKKSYAPVLYERTKKGTEKSLSRQCFTKKAFRANALQQLLENKLREWCKLLKSLINKESVGIGKKPLKTTRYKSLFLLKFFLNVVSRKVS